MEVTQDPGAPTRLETSADGPPARETVRRDRHGRPAATPADTGEWLQVASLDLDAQGVARRADGKVVFVEGALPGETVQARVHRGKKQWEQGVVTAIARESSARVVPRCPHFGLHEGACGGCKMQHLDAAAQVAMKQRVLEDNLEHLGRVTPERVLPAIHGPTWGYRWRARFSVRNVHKKGTVLVGFHERKSRYVADMRECHVVPKDVSDLLLPLRALIGSMDAADTLPQIELAGGVDAADPSRPVTALVLRHLEPLSPGDVAKLRAFAEAHPPVQWWLQPKGPETAHRMDEDGPELAYALPEFGVVMPFKPTDFTQVNPFINQVLVARALRLLDVQSHERVIDWFCGLGNFSLPLATRAREVLGIEGSEPLVARAQANSERNRRIAQVKWTSDAIDFVARNLFEMTPDDLVADGVAEKWLVDPPREGAHALMLALAEAVGGIDGKNAAPAPWTPPSRIVYVSCNPATLARDAGILTGAAGYRCTAAGVVNMFPHTAHVESIAVFERSPTT